MTMWNLYPPSAPPPPCNVEPTSGQLVVLRATVINTRESIGEGVKTKNTTGFGDLHEISLNQFTVQNCIPSNYIVSL